MDTPQTHSQDTYGPLVRWILVLVLLFFSALTLTRFPWSNSFHDEDDYGSMAYEWMHHGRVLSPNITWNFDTTNEMFKNGDAWHPRIHLATFIALTKMFPTASPFFLARLASFLFALVAIALCKFLGPAWGLDSSWLALFLAGNERFFWSSHAFRPEIVLVAFNIALLILLGFQERVTPRRQTIYWLGRGLINFLLISAHGSAVTSIMINSLFVLGGFRRTDFKRRVLLYGFGSLLAVGLFYLWQIFPAGGILVAIKQKQVFSYGLPSASIWYSIKKDLSARWYREIFGVGGSKVAHFLRLLSYTVIFMSGFLINNEKAKATQKIPSQFLAIGIALAYIFFVGDKVDIEIAEMIPFFIIVLVSTMTFPRLTPIKFFPMLALVPNLILCTHHFFLPREQRAINPAEVRSLVAQYKPDLLIGDSANWFEFADLQYCGENNIYISSMCSLPGKKVLWIGDETLFSATPERVARFAKCQQLSLQSNPPLFRLFDCTRN